LGLKGADGGSEEFDVVEDGCDGGCEGESRVDVLDADVGGEEWGFKVCRI